MKMKSQKTKFFGNLKNSGFSSKMAIFGSLLLIVLLAGCAQRGKDKEAFFREYRTGTQGLSINFVQNLPPPRIYDTEEFNAMIEVFNKGAFEVGGPGDRIYISGYDPTIITGIPTTGAQIPKIEGKTQFTPEGAMDTITFKGTISRLLTDKVPVRLLTTACYGYETLASANVCIDPQPFGPTVRQKVCTAQSVATGSQGAPIAVTNVQLEPRPGATGFKITVSNSGGGDVFRYGAQYLQKCSPYDQKGLELDEIDYVLLADVAVSGVSIKNSCKPLDNGHIRLSGGQGSIYCQLTNIRGSTAYITPITITLKYGYRNVLFKDFEIFKGS